MLPRFRAGRPFRVTPALQPDRTVRKTVGDAGGELTTAAADGTRFTLTVPAGALVGEVDVEMTPVGSARGLPFERLGGAVQLGPEDVHFLRPATLRIQPPRPIAARRVVPLRWAGPGRDLHLEPATIRRDAITFELFHFSSPGFALGTNRQYDRLASHSPSARENWARQNLERAIHEQRNGGQLAGAARAAIYVYGNEVARPALEAALQAANPSPEAIAAAIGLELAFERQASLLGLEDASVDDLQTALRELVRKLVDKAERLADERCQRGDPTQALQILAVERARQLTGGLDGADGTETQAYALDAVARCLRFEVALDSEITVTTHGVRAGGGGGSFSYHVVANVPLNADPQQLTTAPATGSLTYTGYSGQRIFAGGCATETDTPVRAPSDPASMTAAFYALHLYPSRNPDPGVELSLSHSNPSETFHQSDNCNGGPGADFTENRWADAFRQLHLLEKPGGDRDPVSGDAFLITRFARGAGFLFAHKEYTQTLSLPVDMRDPGSDYEAVEHTVINVVHRPLPRGAPVA